MAENITFHGAHIRYCDVRHDESGVVSRIHMTSEFTTSVMDGMGWTDPGESCTHAKIEGALQATHLILEPGDKQLKRHELQINIKDVFDFKVVTIEKDEVKRRELRFVIRTLEDGAAAKIEQYVRLIGSHSSNIREIQFHPDERTLIVEFHSGGKYAFDDCTPQMADAFMKAPSAGSFFHKNIRGKFAVRKLSE